MTLTDYFVNNVQLQQEWSYDRNNVSTDDLTPYTRMKVWWRCSKGHEWQAALNSRISLNRNCPYCVNQAVFPGENDIAAAEPEMLKLWHPSGNGKLKPTDLTPGSRKRIWWQCERGHEWQAPAYSVKAGCGCPYCSGKYAILGETDLATTHPEVLQFWSGRNVLLPSEITAGSHKKVWWVCEKGHEWETAVSVVAGGCGCPYCAGRKAIQGENDLATQHPALMEQWDAEKNGNITPSELLPSAHDKVWWRCALGHSWQARVFSRTEKNGAGCPYCTGRKILVGFNDLASQRPKLAEEWNQSLNGELKPTDVTLGSNRKAWWQCSDGHVWQAAIYSRTRKKAAGCPVCAGVTRYRDSRSRRKPLV